MNVLAPVRLGVFAVVSTLLVACGGGGGGGSGGAASPPPATYTIGGTVSGLAGGASVVLQNNGASNLTVSANGSFSFASPVNAGTAFAVTVLTQPGSPPQTCAVASGSGTASANVSSVAVTCTTNSYTVGGTVAGLATGSSVTLQTNGANITVSANGPFTFSAPIPSGTVFGVTVATQPGPPPQTCSVSGGTGTISGANVTSVMVDCQTNAYTLGGTITGLASGATLVLQNGATTVPLTSNGSFAFGTALPSGTAYSVSVQTQPTSPLQTCTVANGTGTVAAANVTNLSVSCSSLYAIGGTLSGLAGGGSVVLQNGATSLSLSASGAFSFPTPVVPGTPYSVTVQTNPTVPGPGQTCTVSNGNGSVGPGNVTSIAVACSNDDQAAPTITARSPMPTAVGSKVQGGVVVVSFSEAVNPSTVNTSSITVQGPAGAVGGSVALSNGNTQATFTPSATLAYDARYTVTVTTAVRDPSGNPLAANASWSFSSGKKIAGGFRHTCARLDDGRVKCWGRNEHGQLGYDDTLTRGDATTPLVGSLAAVNLGAGRTAVAIAAGDFHTCAILDDGNTKCWGINTSGALGVGSAAPALGDAAGEMATLPVLDFGSGRRAIEIALGQYFGCARLDDNSMKCWGRNNNGQLGVGNTTTIGDGAGELAATATVSLGAGLTPVTFSLGHRHVCALLESGSGVRSVKCWGENQWGQLGRGDKTNRGDDPGEMGASLPPVDFGTGRTPTQMLASAGHSCAILDNGSTKCWGLNTWGQVGLNAGNNNGAGAPVDQVVCTGHVTDCVGDEPNEMGDNLPAAIAADAVRLAVGYRTSCVLLGTGQLKCWGTNEFGQLGIEDNSGNKFDIGDQTGEMVSLANTLLKPGTTLEELTAAGFHLCVWNAEDTLNCWGANDYGQLGRNDTNDWGDDAGEMGVALFDVNLGP